MSAYMVSASIITRIDFPDLIAFSRRLMSHGLKYSRMVSLTGIISTFASLILSMNLQGSVLLVWVADADNVEHYKNAIRLSAGSHFTFASNAAVQPRLFTLLFSVGAKGKSRLGFRSAATRV